MTRSSAVFAALTLALLGIGIGIASATAPSGVTPSAHVAEARLAKGIAVNADGVKFQTKASTEVSVLTLTLEPGGTTGWHSHPGLAVISVAEGTGKLYFANCRSKTYRAGSAFVEAGRDKPTVFRNESTSRVVLTVTFIAPRRAKIIRDERAPRRCAMR